MAASPPHAAALLAARFPDLSGITYVTGGGQKSVYRADHRHHGPVALKIFADSADPQRTQREIEAVQQLACDRVPPIHATGLLSGAPKPTFWLVETWLTGDNLRTRLCSGPLSDELVRRVAEDVLYVLCEAEKRHIVHRDVKPENIFMAADESRCWLLDFGIARHLDLSTLTAVGAGQGPLSPGYAPPEQIQNYKDKIDSRADLFALGVTLYEALMGVNPFIQGAADGAEVLRRTIHMPLPRPTRDIGGDSAFSDLVLMLTRGRRTHRPRTAAKAYGWLQRVNG